MENQIIIYGRNPNTGVITPINVSGQGQNTVITTTNVNSLDDLNDVVISGVGASQTIMYNSSNSRFENRRPALNDNSDVSFTGLSNTDILQYNTTLSRWINRIASTPDILSYIFPSTVANIGIATSGEKITNNINITETLNDFGPTLICNTFRITGLTNALYRMKFVFTYNRSTSADPAFYLEFREGSNSNPTLNTRRGFTGGSCYDPAGASISCCSMSIIRDYRVTLPTFVHISFQNETGQAAQYGQLSCNITVERIYNHYN